MHFCAAVGGVPCRRAAFPASAMADTDSLQEQSQPEPEPAAALGRHRATARNRADMLWLRWAVLSVLVLLAVMLLLLGGYFEVVDDAQLRLLCGNPFYLEAEATQNPALSPVGMFGLCVGVTLYLGIVLLRQRRFAPRTQIVLMAAVAATMPGLLCVLWNCVFYVAPLLFCVLFTWVLVVCVPFFRRSRS